MAIYPRIVFTSVFLFSFWYGVSLSPTDHRNTLSDEVDIDDENISFTHVEYPRDKLIEEFKSAFLQKLNLTEPPTSVIPLKLNSEIVDLLMEKHEEQFQTKSIIYPTNNIYSCIESNIRDCSRFEFYFNFDIHAIEKVFLWFHKQRASKPISFTVHFDNSSDIHYYNESTSEFEMQLQWIKFHLEKNALENVNGTLQCTVEVTGLYYVEEENLPVLIVTKPNPHENRQKPDNRVKRGEDCKCRAVDRYISFKDINWHKWVIEPARLNIRACSGVCPYVQGTSSLSYGNLMYNYDKYHKIQEDNGCSKFWVPRCYPSKMDKVKIIYVENNATTPTITELQDMVVGSCACMSHTCFARD
ncbi:bone morphogenetic protein 2-like [Argiope bruennichi]|uniref:Growth/differentiation factor 3 like protein n=1 Tax=Argiope bruennichi TaxID=94029 RepID=A0A8T0FAM5_ARGBR|nr:bone morphogenetic protein 2-like [Argiope bruennichi]KAF8787285.1 Growth/differentiation factor 3 like protein [Argiope bruennichi]